MRDGALKHALEYGVAFLHETQAPAEQEVVNTLFSSGAIQVSCCTRTCKASSGSVLLVMAASYCSHMGPGRQCVKPYGAWAAVFVVRLSLPHRISQAHPQVYMIAHHVL